MAYKEKYINYRCVLNYSNPNFETIKNTLISVLGIPKEMGLLHPFFVVNNEGKEEGEGFQLRLTSKKLSKLQKMYIELDIPFEEVFERDWCHYHIDCYLGEGEEMEDDNLYHEGTAYEYEDYWEIYYEDGSLSELPGLRENNFFIQKLNNNDISNPDKDIPLVFKKWVIENSTVSFHEQLKNKQRR